MERFNVQWCVKEAEKIEKMLLNFLDECSRTGQQYNYIRLSKEARPIQRDILRRYETWFTVSKLIIRRYSDRYEIFENNYSNVKNHILLEVDSKSEDKFLNDFLGYFDEQVNILHSIIPIISLTENNFKKMITADILGSELEQADKLYEYDYYRPAGVIAGIALERWLKTLCEINLINIGENDTIEPLSIKLYKSKQAQDFDKTLMKSIQHLASIRNKCAHPKEEIKPHEVRELIDKVKKITFLTDKL